jgi:hypothetical protein
MKPQDAESEFRAFMLKRGLALKDLSARDGLDAMLAFYRAIRGDGLRFDQDEDMLLFQWGIYPRNDASVFVYDITRQLIFDGYDDENIWQLSLSFYFPPTEPLIALGSGSEWCQCVDELPEFVSFAKAHPATLAVGGRADGHRNLIYSSVG